MGLGLLPVFWIGMSLGAGATEEGPWLYEPAFDLGTALYGSPRPYYPQPGDILLATDKALWARVGHRLAGTAGVHHSGFFFLRSSGELALLEAGPFNSLKVEVTNPYEVLLGHEQRGNRVWIRRRCVPLTIDQSAQLTRFAEAQEGKRFATIRLICLITPLRARGPLRTRFVGKPHGSRISYFCSELVMESFVAAGLADPETTRPSATLPRDVFMGTSVNPYLKAHLELNRCWYPPARWMSQPVGRGCD